MSNPAQKKWLSNFHQQLTHLVVDRQILWFWTANRFCQQILKVWSWILCSNCHRTTPHIRRKMGQMRAEERDGLRLGPILIYLVGDKIHCALDKIHVVLRNTDCSSSNPMKSMLFLRKSLILGDGDFKNFLVFGWITITISSPKTSRILGLDLLSLLVWIVLRAKILRTYQPGFEKPKIPSGYD